MYERFPMLMCLGLVFLTLFFTAALVGAGDRGPVIPKATGEHCVADTDFMRKNHMDLIVHQRDETVLKGIRDEPFSLVECVDCHVQRDAGNKPIRIDAEGQFCASCHSFVAAKIDCFSCHAAIPATPHEKRVDGSKWLPDKHMLAWTHNLHNSIDAAEGNNIDDSSTRTKQ